MLAAVGLLVWISPHGKRVICALLLVTTNGAAAYFNWRNRATVAALLQPNRFMLAAWLSVSLALLILAQVPIPPRSAVLSARASCPKSATNSRCVTGVRSGMRKRRQCSRSVPTK